MEDVLLVRNTHYGHYFYNEIEKTALFSQSFPNENLSMWDNVLFQLRSVWRLYKIVFLLRLSSFSRKGLFCTANFACFRLTTLSTDVGLSVDPSFSWGSWLRQQSPPDSYRCEHPLPAGGVTSPENVKVRGDIGAPTYSLIQRIKMSELRCLVKAFPARTSV